MTRNRFRLPLALVAAVLLSSISMVGIIEAVYLAGGGKGLTASQGSVLVQVVVVAWLPLALLYLWLLLRWMRRRRPTPPPDEAAIRAAWDAHQPPQR
jgi:membrane protein implicated in regulation of membrane protease activity